MGVGEKKEQCARKKHPIVARDREILRTDFFFSQLCRCKELTYLSDIFNKLPQLASDLSGGFNFGPSGVV